MNLNITTFWNAKHGNRDEEYEDASAYSPLEAPPNVAVHRLAVADGATESVFSGYWANLLVRQYCNSEFWDIPAGRNVPNVDHLQQGILESAREWSRDVFSRNLPWHALEKAQKGAFSSLLGLTIQTMSEDSGSGLWSAVAVGDSCLFQLRNDEVIVKWPIQESQQFGNHPLLLSTEPSKNTTVWSQIHDLVIIREWEPGDIWLLMTDALAHWFMREVEAQQQPWLSVSAIWTSQPAFKEWLRQLRSEGRIRNDDVTLMIVQIPSDVECTPHEIPSTK